MKPLNLIMAALLAFLTVPFGAVSSSAGEKEQVVHQQVVLGYFDIWKHTNGAWQDTNNDGKPDVKDNRNSTSITFQLPQELLEEYELTGVEAQYILDRAAYEAAGGRHGESWQDFNSYWYSRRAQVISLTASQDSLTLGKTKLTWDLYLRTEDSSEQPYDLKRPEVRQFLGLSDRDFSNLAEGYRYMLLAIITWYGVPKQGAVDLAVTSLTANTDTVEQGKRYSGAVSFSLISNASTPVTATLNLTHNGYPIPGIDGQTVTFNPGETKSYSFNFTGQSGSSLLAAEITPVNAVDQNPANNKKTLKLDLAERSIPELNAELTLQAYSQPGYDVFGNWVESRPRPEGTARWTDTVKATLKPDRPMPPKGGLDWWKITRARITYPKQHPDFTFGTPYEPLSTTTKEMRIISNGHQAEAEFREDWSMAGTGIYSIIEKKMMAEKPKKYPITVEYTTRYQYSWTEYDEVENEDGETETVSWTETGTETVNKKVIAYLLVNGTGVNSLSQ